VDPLSPIGRATTVTSASLLGFSSVTLTEMRRVLEAGGAALAAERATADQCAVLAEEVSSLYAAVADPQLFQLHDARFHRAVGAASGNPIVASLVELLTDACFQQARTLPPLASVDTLKAAAATHRRIYRAIRNHDAVRARAEMDAHLAPRPASARTHTAASGQ
jgi:GntR family transcriptional repressor for pyruvate dehydrogenase complex